MNVQEAAALTRSIERGNSVRVLYLRIVGALKQELATAGKAEKPGLERALELVLAIDPEATA